MYIYIYILYIYIYTYIFIYIIAIYIIAQYKVLSRSQCTGVHLTKRRRHCCCAACSCCHLLRCHSDDEASAADCRGGGCGRFLKNPGNFLLWLFRSPTYYEKPVQFKQPMAHRVTTNEHSA